VVRRHLHLRCGLHRRSGLRVRQPRRRGVTLSSDAYGSVFYLATGFHGLHVTGGLIAFLLIIGRTFTTRRYTHAQATGAVVTSYYWHFVDVVWIALFAMIYVLK
jgi:cytochrome c oxidase subunit 3